MRKIIALIILFLTFSIHTFCFGNTTDQKTIKLRLYGHVFLENKNTPLKNFLVYVSKNNAIIGKNNTNTEGEFDFVINNRDDFLNLCIQGKIEKEIGYCVTVSAFQKIGKTVDGQEVREIEYSFFTNNNGENLNQRLENEVTNTETEKAFDQYEEIKLGIQQEQEKAAIEKQKAEEMEKQKAKYHMPNNTEMVGPLDSIQILGTIKSSDEKVSLLQNKTTIRILDYQGVTIQETQLGAYNDFNITIEPKQDGVFLHPVNLVVINSQKNVIDGELIPVFSEEYRLVTKEKNIFNIELKPYTYNSFIDKSVQIREDFPFLGIFIIIFILISGIYIFVKNKNELLKNN